MGEREDGIRARIEKWGPNPTCCEMHADLAYLLERVADLEPALDQVAELERELAAEREAKVRVVAELRAQLDAKARVVTELRSIGMEWRPELILGAVQRVGPVPQLVRLVDVDPLLICWTLDLLVVCHLAPLILDYDERPGASGHRCRP